MFWAFVWTLFWSLAIILGAIARHRTDRFDPFWRLVNGLCTIAVLATTLGVLALILMK